MATQSVRAVLARALPVTNGSRHSRKRPRGTDRRGVASLHFPLGQGRRPDSDHVHRNTVRSSERTHPRCRRAAVWLLEVWVMGGEMGVRWVWDGRGVVVISA